MNLLVFNNNNNNNTIRGIILKEKTPEFVVS